MSKTFEQNVEKTTAMTAGIRKNLKEVTSLGIIEKDLISLEAEAQKAIEMIREVENLRAVVSQKLKSANDQLEGIKERSKFFRMIIKNNYPQEEWIRFGITDKR